MDGHTLQPAQEGTILWEEFVQIHRRMVEGRGTTTTDPAPLPAVRTELPAASSFGARRRRNDEAEVIEVTDDAGETL